MAIPGGNRNPDGLLFPMAAEAPGCRGRGWDRAGDYRLEDAVMTSEWIWTLIAGAAAAMMATVAWSASSLMVAAGAVIMILVLLVLVEGRQGFQ